MVDIHLKSGRIIPPDLNLESYVPENMVLDESLSSYIPETLELKSSLDDLER